ncbi:serine/threonine-protein kinase ATM-like [Quercus lobata]|uniref:serine/threonine-protein kinase ATM-like n=1 Tax=Quercus lobata TaxID=97700 RepID=UPI001243A9F4|nr:serine/threonine-protein kinase ATM-like [Quercus lobata]
MLCNGVEHFDSPIMESPDFSHNEMLPLHIEIVVSAVTQIDEPDSLYGIIQSHKELVLSVFRASEESTEYIYSKIIKLQVLVTLVIQCS